ncbi:terminase gpA endonuclease subunit [Deferrisoma camini]|uniref:terminase gpA endonuclease subunit n=1 Tax=Deferrisoma camini TaxID=1035120 RepID=UPI00046CD466|nr:terminase gpA endonuclease subunit [Deferrisoma camini]
MGEAARQLELVREVRFRFYPAERRVFRRPEKIKSSVWAEKYLRLPASVTSMPGPFRLSRTPYLRGVMDTRDEPHVRRTVFCAAPQTGKTLSAYVPLFRDMDRPKGLPALIVMSGQDGAKKISKDYILPIMRETPRLRALFPPDPDDLTAYRIRLANGMRLYTAWSTSPQLLKTFPACYGVGDEVDDWPTSSGDRGGDPEALFDVRLRTYPRESKLTLVSSPVLPEGIWSKLVGCQEVRVYLVRCPECGAEQRMVWPRIRWPEAERDPERILAERLAVYECAGCGSQWDDADRDRAVDAGRWQAVDKRYLDLERRELLDDPFPQPPARPAREPISVGFHLPAWCSKFVPLAKAVAEFLKAHHEPDPAARREKLKAWTNNYPALPWVEEPPAERAESAILALRDDRPAGLVPAEAAALVVGIDTQDDGFWYEIRAFAAVTLTSWLVRYGFVTAWEDLERVVLHDRYRDPEGQELTVQLGLQDSGGHRTAEVYDWCRRVRVVRPSRGEQRMRTPIAYSKIDTYPGSTKPIPGGVQLVRVNTTYFKDALSARLQVAPADPGAWLLHAETAEDYARHYTAEYRDEAGIWQPRGSRPNHLWDCGVLCLAAAEILGVRHWRKPEETAEKPKPPPLTRRQKLW